MLPSKRALIAAGMLSLSACSMLPSMPPTVPRQVPEACLRPCDSLPKPVDSRELTLRLWEYEVVELYGGCRRRQAVCAAWFDLNR